MNITIQTNADFTPKGKRTFRVVTLDQGRFIRWYVGGRIYNTLRVTIANINLTRQWANI